MLRGEGFRAVRVVAFGRLGSAGDVNEDTKSALGVMEDAGLIVSAGGVEVEWKKVGQWKVCYEPCTTSSMLRGVKTGRKERRRRRERRGGARRRRRG